MKVYKIEELGEVTHFAFDGNKKDALNWYIEETMCDENEITSISLLPRKNWRDITIKFNEDEESLVVSLEEYMKGHINNEVICSTAYL